MLRNPKNYTHFIKGVSQYRSQKYDQAAQYFVASMIEQLDSNHEFTIEKQMIKKTNIKKYKSFYGSYQALLNLSCCLIKQKNYSKAKKLCYRALQFNAYNSLPYYNLATINIKKENFSQALNQIKCALSCEYLKRYQKLYDKKFVDLAIEYAPNNLSAIKYRISFNSNFLRFFNSLNSLSNYTETQSSIYQHPFLNSQEESNKKFIMEQLKFDIETLKKFSRIYELQFNQNNSNLLKENKPNNFYISSIKPQFILQNKNNSFSRQVYEKQSNKNMQTQLQVLKELKNLREQYLRLIAQNQTQINIQDILNTKLCEKYISLLETQKIKTNKLHQTNKSQLYVQYQNTVQTSFQLQDSYDNPQQDQTDFYQIKQPIYAKSKIQKNKNININIMKNKNNINKQNLPLSIPNKKQNLLTINHLCRNYPLSNCNRKINRKGLSENQYLATSVISIKDYQQNPITQHCDLQSSQQQIPKYNVNLIQSVIVPNSSHNQSIQLFQIQQNTKHYEYSLMRNRSCQSLINNLLSPARDLKNSHYQYNQFNSRLLQSKSQLKLMSCSKCSVDHDNDCHRQKNVNLQINLTQIYNYQCNFAELQTFCVIKHNGQQLRTQTSKGKFPNWKQPIQFNVDYDALNQEDKFYDRSEQEINQNRIVKIQLWAKPLHFKKDSTLNPNDLHQLIGQQEINLKQQKWNKKKIILENKLLSHQKRKTAYMYVRLQKIKQKKM